MSWQLRLLSGAILVACLAVGANAQTVQLLKEDFESIKLGDSVDEANFGEGVWANTPPAGWSIVNDLPGLEEEGVGVTEWKGWSFADKEWWVPTAGDQRRSEFELGEGTVAIADPDEWDDLGSPKDLGLYNTFLKTKSISLAGIQANSLTLDFVSSWRPEGFDDVDNTNNQTAQITASYDGGAPVEVMLWDSEEGGPNYHDHMPNEEVSVQINNPAGASNVVLSFNLLLSYNDWWWAIDNITLSGKSGGGVKGDFNASGALDVADINALAAAVRAGSNEAKYDVTGDSKVDATDHTSWVKDLKKTWVGDADLNGEFNTGDFISVFQAGRFETGQEAGWGEGDWNGDNLFNTTDFIAAFQDGGFEQGPRAAVSAVPEPATAGLLVLVGLGLLHRRRNG